MAMLKELAVGDRARVTGFNQGGSAYRRKLLSMGLTPGAELAVTRVAPMGDPVEIRVRGFSLSLRKAEADALVVEKLS
ncbi:FeoA family protein [Pseudomonas schmalbachii]|nr:FeoA family protein [Pseudomonas schmalbachii]